MEYELQNLDSKELWALLRQETIKLLFLLEKEGTIAELEVLSDKMLVIGDLLKNKEQRPEGQYWDTEL